MPFHWYHPADAIAVQRLDVGRTVAGLHSVRWRCAVRFRLGPPPACADALTPRRLRVPDLTPS